MRQHGCGQLHPLLQVQAYLMELVPDQVCGLITERAKIPIISLGSGPNAHGQLLIFHDMFGLYPKFTPKMATESDRSETYLLLESAENLNTKLRLTALARQINENMVRHVLSLAQNALRSCEKTLRRARVAVVGTTEPKTAADTLVKLLEARGAKVNIHDPLSSKYESISLNHVLNCSIVLLRKKVYVTIS
jgi:hypothetical protein